MAKYTTGKWDLSELVQNPKSPKFEARIKNLQNQAKKFQKIKKSLSPRMSQNKLSEILSEIEQIYEKASIIGGFASLSYSSDTQSDEATALMSRISKLGADVSNMMLFFSLWWKKELDEKNATRLIRGSDGLANYLHHKRLLAKYSLSEPEEKIINILDVTGASALVKLYDKITNAFVYTVQGKKMSREELVSLVRSPNSKTRQNAYRALLGKFDENKGVLGEIYQNIVRNWKDEGLELRGYKSPISMRNIGNDIDDKTVSSLLAVCKKNSGVFGDFFKLKAKMLKLKKLRRYDLYAPITKTNEKSYSYDKSIRLVLESLGRFNPVLAEYAKSVITQNHIDSSVRSGKRDGAFCSTLSPKITPYVLVNFTGKSKDVFTLAHELGHAVHSIAASKQSILVQDAPLPLAETASTFSELLLYDNLSSTINDKDKKTMLAEKLDDLYATIMRQSYFTLFEIDAHKKIGQSATVDEITNVYLAGLRDQFGSTVELSNDFGIEWSCIPHFYHSPFYCYAYSFGNLLALSLFQRFKKEGQSFAPAYIEILAAGGSQKPEALLLQYGIDITSRRFWQDGFDYVQGQVKELSKIT